MTSPAGRTPDVAALTKVAAADVFKKGRLAARLVGHPVYTMDVKLPRGTSRTIVLHLIEPAGTGAPIVLRQPLVRPLYVTLNDAVCSRDQ